MAKVHVMRPIPGAREQQVKDRQAQQSHVRRWHLRRGLSGLQFAASHARRSIEHSMRELARACYRLGYDVAVTHFPSETGGWGETSTRHLVGMVRPPVTWISWGDWALEESLKGASCVNIDVPDSWHWAKAEYVQKYNDAADLFIAPTAPGVQWYVGGGVTIPTAAVPLGVDGGMYRPLGFNNRGEVIDSCVWHRHGEPDEDCYLFLLAGYMQERKGMPIAVEAFKRAFRQDDPVALVVKTVSEAWGNSVANYITRHRGRHRIGYTEKNLSECDFARLLGSVDCYVSAHMREGFGLIPLQAMSCGTRVVATNFDGPTEYLTPENAVLVEPTGTWCPDSSDVPKNDLWASIDVDDLAAGMRAAFEETTEARKTACEAARQTARTYSWERSAEALVGAIQASIGPVRKRHDLARARAQNTVSVLVPCRNGQADFDRLCESLYPGYEWPGAVLEVIALDDASEVPIKVPQIAPPGTRVIRSNAWIGEMAARDWLLHEATGDYVFATDADVEFVDGWLTAMLKRAQSDPLTIWAPVLLLPDGRVWGAGGCYKNYQGRVLPAWHHLMGARMDEDELALVAERDLTYAPGAGWFAHRESLLARWQWTGGYFPTVFGDVDMAFWVRAHGMRFRLAPEVRLVHHHGSYTQQQTETDDQRERFTEHAREFTRQWGEWIADDIARGALVVP